MDRVFYTDQHEWIRVEDGTAYIGITEYAQEQLGDIVFVELPEIGKVLSKGDEAAIVESVKAASEVYMPVSGEVVAINEALADDPALVNREAMGGGWFVKLKVSNTSECEGLMDEAAYQTFIAAQS